MKKIILSLGIILAVIFAVYDTKFNSDDYDILLKNRFTKLGFGVMFCGEKNHCMENHKSSFEIWHFAHTVHGGIADNRLYPPLRDLGDDFDYDFLYVVQGTSLMGFNWIKMTPKKKSNYLMGYEDGYLNALAYHVEDKKKRGEAVLKLPSFYDSKKSDRDNLIKKIDAYYAQAEAYKTIPVPLVIRLVINSDLGIKDEKNRHMIVIYEKELMETVSSPREQNNKH
jgi:hypothetical protein